MNFGLPALTVPGVHDLFGDGYVARVDLAAGTVENLTSGEAVEGPGLPALVLGILEAGGLFPMLQRDGYVPA